LPKLAQSSTFVETPFPMIRFATLSLVVLIFGISGCVTYSPFTEPMLTEFKLDNKNIKSVQFYLSEEILMYRIQQEQALGKQDGAFVKSTGGVSEKIRIKRKTPCVVERIDKDGFFYVRFEEGKDKVLKFRRADNNRYYLATEIINNRHQISYGGELYYVNTPSLISFLMVRIRNEKGSSNTRSITGKRAN
jgi:hypothetical protein